MINKEKLRQLYLEEKRSVKDISDLLDCSVNKVIYWMNKHGIERRTISEAIYLNHNPNGDPFTLKGVKSLKDAELYGLGIGLYWGEGNKANKYSVRIGNTDPYLISKFRDFLVRFFSINPSDIKYGLQIFSDVKPELALKYWVTSLGVDSSQFYKVTITKSRAPGTYKTKNLYGVTTLHYHNKKLRDILVGMLPK